MLLRDSYAEVDRSAIIHNVKLARQLAPQQKIMAVVKANAYGHGLLEVVAMLDDWVDFFGVATLSEAVAIKREMPIADVVILGHTPNRLLSVVNEYGIVQTIFSVEQAEILNACPKPSRVHLKIDSGFHRLGFPANAAAVEAIAAICKLKNINVEGIFSHLALAGDEADRLQYQLFCSVVDQLAARGIHFKYRHICDSIAFTRYPEFRLDMVRLGAWLFGMKGIGQTADLREALTVKSYISHISAIKKGAGVSYDYLYRAARDGRIGTIPIGYGDGYPRNMSKNGGYVIINGEPAPVVGIINMDQLMVDLTDLVDAQVGDEVIVYGAAVGLPISTIADIAQTNKNEILSRLTARLPRIYR